MHACTDHPPQAPEVQRLALAYEQLTAETLEQLLQCYAPDAHFRDPFNDVRGVQSIGDVFRHMFRTLAQPRFTVLQCQQQEGEAFLLWRLDYRLRAWRPARARCIRGATHVRFDSQGRVLLHRDYWDAAEELYETLPLLGPLMRWLRARMAG